MASNLKTGPLGSPEKKEVSMERHLQTLIVVLIVGLLGWVGTTVQQTQVLVARLTVEVEFLKQEVKRPSTKFEAIERRLEGLAGIERRLDNIEDQMQLHMNGTVNGHGKK